MRDRGGHRQCGPTIAPKFLKPWAPAHWTPSILPCWNGPGSCNGAEALLAKIQTIHRLIGAEAVSEGRRQHSPRSCRSCPKSLPLIAIGASAGGPAALARILSLSARQTFPPPIVIVQHVDSQFAQGLANWLDDQTPLPVRLASEGDHPQAGHRPAGRARDHHLVFTSPSRLGYIRQPSDCPYRPSIDVFFKSICDALAGRSCRRAVDRHGPRRRARLEERSGDAGHHTIAQDQATSAVYGMPKAAAEIKAASEILPLGPNRSALRSSNTANASKSMTDTLTQYTSSVEHKPAVPTAGISRHGAAGG